MVEILDLIHASQYVWKAAAYFTSTDAERKAFTRDRLRRIRDGEVRGLRRQASQRGLKGKSRRDVERIRGYFLKHCSRMRYHEYLAAGYPLATSVIEGACRHPVMESAAADGIRWTLDGARAMLNVRAVFQSDYWTTIQTRRQKRAIENRQRFRGLLKGYPPITLAVQPRGRPVAPIVREGSYLNWGLVSTMMCKAADDGSDRVFETGSIGSMQLQRVVLVH